MAKFKAMYRPKCSDNFVFESQNSRRKEQTRNEAFHSELASTKHNEVKNQSEETKLVNDSINLAVEARSNSDKKTMKKFPELLMEMISDEKNSSAIVWYPNGQHFEVISKEIFLSDVLPRYMKATKWSSFTRKLSRWGFERIKKGRYTNSFFHKMFRKDDIILCRKINCKTTCTQTIPNDSQDTNHINTNENNLNVTLTEVRNDLSLLHHERWAQHVVNRQFPPIRRNDLMNQIYSQVFQPASLDRLRNDLFFQNTNSIIESAMRALQPSPKINFAMNENHHKQAISFDDHKLVSELIFKRRTMRTFTNLNVPLNRRSHFARSA